MSQVKSAYSISAVKFVTLPSSGITLPKPSLLKCLLGGSKRTRSNRIECPFHTFPPWHPESALRGHRRHEVDQKVADSPRRLAEKGKQSQQGGQRTNVEAGSANPHLSHDDPSGGLRRQEILCRHLTLACHHLDLVCLHRISECHHQDNIRNHQCKWLCRLIISQIKKELYRP